jgi:hypothetical protein
VDCTQEFGWARNGFGVPTAILDVYDISNFQRTFGALDDFDGRLSSRLEVQPVLEIPKAKISVKLLVAETLYGR